MKLSIERTITYQPPGDEPAIRITLASCNVLTNGRYDHMYLPAARQWLIAATDKDPGEIIAEVRENPGQISQEAQWLFWLVDKAYGWALVCASVRKVEQKTDDGWEETGIPDAWLNPGDYMEALPDDLSDELMKQARACNPHLFKPDDSDDQEKKIGVISVN